MSDPGMCSVCPKVKRVGFALETQGSEPPVALPGRVMHAFSVAAESDRQELGLLQTVVWLGPEDDPQATTEGHPWRDYTYAQTTTVHQTDDLDFVPILPSGKGGRP
jgi:hypothetical protein